LLRSDKRWQLHLSDALKACCYSVCCGFFAIPWRCICPMHFKFAAASRLKNKKYFYLQSCICTMHFSFVETGSNRQSEQKDGVASARCTLALLRLYQGQIPAMLHSCICSMHFSFVVTKLDSFILIQIRLHLLDAL